LAPGLVYVAGTDNPIKKKTKTTTHKIFDLAMALSQIIIQFIHNPGFAWHWATTPLHSHKALGLIKASILRLPQLSGVGWA
jgi:hypothetical protein